MLEERQERTKLSNTEEQGASSRSRELRKRKEEDRVQREGKRKITSHLLQVNNKQKEEADEKDQAV